MAKVTVWEAWAADVRSLPCGVVECIERKLVDSVEFDGDMMCFTEALADADMPLLASRNWAQGRTWNGVEHYSVTVDGWVTYMAEVVEEAAVKECLTAGEQVAA